MYCILVAGMPAAGKSTIAEALAQRFQLPVISKDAMKEVLFDTVGFQSREGKVKLGIASMEMMYYTAGQLMKAGQPFILENNFEHASEHGIKALLQKHHYPALTIALTGDYKVIYRRLLERDTSPDRHRGHVVNDCYPEKKKRSSEEINAAAISYEDYVRGIESRGFNAFWVDGERIEVDTTDFSQINMEELFSQIVAWKKEMTRRSNRQRKPILTEDR